MILIVIIKFFYNVITLKRKVPPVEHRTGKRREPKKKQYLDKKKH